MARPFKLWIGFDHFGAMTFASSYGSEDGARRGAQKWRDQDRARSIEVMTITDESNNREREVARWYRRSDLTWAEQ